MAYSAESVTSYLDEAHHELRQGSVAHAVDALVDYLGEARRSVTVPWWHGSIKPICLSHPILPVLHEDPYTWRAFHKPRGYPGDAVMLDFVYTGVLPEGTSPRGQEIFRATTASPNARSLRERRNVIANTIDAVASRTANARILSLACGHLREADSSAAVRGGAISEYLAMDQDAESLAVVEREHAGQGIRTVHTSIKRIVQGTYVDPKLSELDFVYAAGLFDYLHDVAASRLIAAMFAMLRSGGSLLIANYVAGSHGRGYMEAIMDWELIYRDGQDLERVANVVPPHRIASQRSHLDRYGNVAYLEITAA